MLVLSRKQGEHIVIDGNITVTVFEIRGGRVSLGFQAPPEIPILRGELHARGEQEGKTCSDVTEQPEPAFVI